MRKLLIGALIALAVVPVAEAQAPTPITPLWSSVEAAFNQLCTDLNSTPPASTTALQTDTVNLGNSLGNLFNSMIAQPNQSYTQAQVNSMLAPITSNVTSLSANVASITSSISTLQQQVAALQNNPNPNPPPVSTESSEGTKVTSTTGSITDASGNKWTLNPLFNIQVNGAAVTGQLTGWQSHELFYHAHNVYILGLDGNWYEVVNGNPIKQTIAPPGA